MMQATKEKATEVYDATKEKAADAYDDQGDHQRTLRGRQGESGSRDG